MDILSAIFHDMRSPEQKWMDRERYESKMLPFGSEQKKEAGYILHGVPKRLRNETAVFLYLVAKETWATCEEVGMEPAQCAAEAMRKMKKMRLSHKDNLPFILALAILDRQIRSLEEYPQFEDVYALSKQLYPEGPDQPNWEALATAGRRAYEENE